MTTNDSEQILESTITPIDDLTPHPENYRVHPQVQLDHIITSIRESGFYRNIVASADGFILAGHGTIEASRQMGITEVPVVRLDVNHDHPLALKVLVQDNYLGKFAVDDDRQVALLLETISEVDELAGTGFTEEMVNVVLMATTPKGEVDMDFDADEEWPDNLPDFDGAPRLARRFTIDFMTEKDRDDFFKQYPDLKATRRKSDFHYGTWWPDDSQQDLKSIEFVQGDET